MKETQKKAVKDLGPFEVLGYSNSTGLRAHGRSQRPHVEEARGQVALDRFLAKKEQWHTVSPMGRLRILNITGKNGHTEW
jgi:hypothetical protein